MGPHVVRKARWSASGWFCDGLQRSDGRQRFGVRVPVRHRPQQRSHDSCLRAAEDAAHRLPRARRAEAIEPTAPRSLLHGKPGRSHCLVAASSARVRQRAYAFPSEMHVP